MDARAWDVVPCSVPQASRMAKHPMRCRQMMQVVIVARLNVIVALPSSTWDVVVIHRGLGHGHVRNARRPGRPSLLRHSLAIA